MIFVTQIWWLRIHNTDDDNSNNSNNYHGNNSKWYENSEGVQIIK